MCEPTTVLLAVTAATAMIGYVEAADMADKQQNAIEAGFAQQMETVKEQYSQIDKAATQQMTQRAQDAMKERSRLRTIAGESGTSGGVSDQRIMNETRFNEGSDIATIEANRSSNMKQTELEAKSIKAGTSTQLSQIKQPSLIGTGLQIAGAYYTGEAKKAALNPQK